MSTTDMECDLLARLAELGQAVMKDIPENRHFRDFPDDVNEHAPRWHQFGIITHTRKVSQYYRQLVPGFLQQWNLAEMVALKLAEPIGKHSRAELLPLSLPLHDLGKFARNFKNQRGAQVPNYAGHEALSEKLILSHPFINDTLRGYGLSDAQIVYIARCAGLHYELAKVRDRAKNLSQGYSIAFVHSPECRQAIEKLLHKFPDFMIEIGLLYLCDSMAKTDVIIEADTDSQIEAQMSFIYDTIQQRQLHPLLITSIRQVPVNLAVTRKYLSEIKSRFFAKVTE